MRLPQLGRFFLLSGNGSGKVWAHLRIFGGITPGVRIQ